MRCENCGGYSSRADSYCRRCGAEMRNLRLPVKRPIAQPTVWRQAAPVLARGVALVALGVAAVVFPLAFAVGGALAYLNYRWIVAVVDTLVRGAQAGRVPRRAYVKLLAPLLLLGAGLYVIFSRSLVSVGGLVGGLLLLVAAVMMEAAYQVYLAVRS